VVGLVPLLGDRDLFRLVAWTLASYRTHPDWDDLFQEGLIRAWRSLAGAVTVAHARTRVVKAARWGADEYLRSGPHRHRERSLTGWDASQPDFAATLVERLDRRRRVALALAAMQPRERRLVLLRTQEGLTFQQIAAREGVSLGRVHQIVQRGLARARRAAACSQEEH